VAGAVDVRVVALVGLILHVRDRDRDDLGRVAHGAALGDVRVGLDFGEALARLNARIAAVSVVLPWSTWPMVPTFTCGFLRSNVPLAMWSSGFD
jgi:hypothetical protein